MFSMVVMAIEGFLSQIRQTNMQLSGLSSLWCGSVHAVKYTTFNIQVITIVTFKKYQYVQQKTIVSVAFQYNMLDVIFISTCDNLFSDYRCRRGCISSRWLHRNWVAVWHVVAPSSGWWSCGCCVKDMHSSTWQTQSSATGKLQTKSGF